MPRYFFNVNDGRNMFDGEGTVFASPDDARAQAMVAAGLTLKNSGADFWDMHEWRMHVTDEQGATICRIHLGGSTVNAGWPRPEDWNRLSSNVLVWSRSWAPF